MTPVSAAHPSPHTPPVPAVVSAIVPAVPSAMVDKLDLGLAVITVEDGSFRLVEFIENSTAIRNPGKCTGGPGNTYQGSASHKAKYSGQK
ncbi:MULTISPECIES: hypothetical protein [unclassified Mesorhizobium]|uniref:hypothetical protein n=1 Tax=unclassified Mesorhizobium TaxID=325217 RepID=UPI00301571B5